MITNAITFCLAADPDAILFQAGGSLLEHETHDIDIIVKMPHSDSAAMLEHSKEYYKFGFHKVNVCEAYNEKKDEPGSFDMVIKLTCPDGMIIDLCILFDQSRDLDDFIFEQFTYFPLSIQQIAKRLDTGQMYRSIWQPLDTIHYLSEGKALDKYKKYYPDRIFKPYVKED